jgi:hypothetical protein
MQITRKSNKCVCKMKTVHLKIYPIKWEIDTLRSPIFISGFEAGYVKLLQVIGCITTGLDPTTRKTFAILKNTSP